MNEDGSPGGGFGAGGLWSRPYTRVSGLAIAPGGKIVLLMRAIEQSHGEWVESKARVARLRGSGAFDRRFGRRGEATLKLPKHSSIAAIATDSAGVCWWQAPSRSSPAAASRGGRTSASC